MITRKSEALILKLLRQFPAVGLIGPRQCGKTTLARTIQKKQKGEALYYDLESPADIRKFDDAELFLTQQQDYNIIIDEVQRLPALFSTLRSVIDRKKRAGRFMLLGSASPELVKGTSETLAGRIYYIEAYPFNLTELPEKKNTLQKHWLRGGFPDAFLAKTESAAFLWLDAFARTFVERDLNTLFGETFSPQLMFRLWRMLAYKQGSPWNAQAFSKSLGISAPTVNRYLEYLEGAFMIRRLAPWFVNGTKRLVKSPKVYIRDSGLLHYLLDIHNQKTLFNHPSSGESWEGYVIEQVIEMLPNHIKPFYYRTHDGSEMDLVLVKGVKVIACIEIKYSTAPTLSRGFYESIADLRCKNNFIIVAGNDPAWQYAKNVRITGLKGFLEHDLVKLSKLR